MNADERELLHRHLNGDLDGPEQASFLSRLQSSPELRRALAAQALDETLVSELVLEGRRSARPAPRRRSWIPLSVAAAMLIGLTLVLTLGREKSLPLRVVSVEGSATFHRGDIQKPVQSGIELREGDRIETVRGSVAIELPGGLLELRDNSSVAFVEGGWRLRMTKGILDARGDALTISSELGTAQLRNAVARVELDAELMRVEAEAGSVVVETEYKPTLEISAGQYVLFGLLFKPSMGRLIARAKVDDAVRRAARFLESRRSDIVTPIMSEKRHGPAPRRTYAELALLALHRAGYPSSHPMMVELLGFVKGRSLESTYATALQAMALAEIDPAAHRDRLRQCAQFLVDSQCANGQWDYGARIDLIDVPLTGPIRPRSQGPAAGDNSVSSYAALGLYACFTSGIEIDRDLVYRAGQWWIRSQNSDGGWGYNDSGDRTANDGGKKTLTTNASYGSATASAVAALIALQRIRGSDTRVDEIQKGEAWLATNFTVDHNPRKDPGFVHLHWLVAAERAAHQLRTERFGSREWYPEGAEFLLRSQQPTGGWVLEQGEFMGREMNDVLDTCLGILFLRRTR